MIDVIEACYDIHADEPAWLSGVLRAIAPDLESVFATMSTGSSIIHARGHMVDYLPSAAKAGVTEERWTQG